MVKLFTDIWMIRISNPKHRADQLDRGSENDASGGRRPHHLDITYIDIYLYAYTVYIYILYTQIDIHLYTDVYLCV